jgi:hypothetical protein
MRRVDTYLADVMSVVEKKVDGGLTERLNTGGFRFTPPKSSGSISRPRVSVFRK